MLPRDYNLLMVFLQGIVTFTKSRFVILNISMKSFIEEVVLIGNIRKSPE